MKIRGCSFLKNNEKTNSKGKKQEEFLCEKIICQQWKFSKRSDCEQQM
jgi:hypothetical protein